MKPQDRSKTLLNSDLEIFPFSRKRWPFDSGWMIWTANNKYSISALHVFTPLYHLSFKNDNVDEYAKQIGDWNFRLNDSNLWN